MKNIFIDGPISPTFIAESIAKHSSKTTIGAHQIFLGQIRADEKNNQKVVQISYETYLNMANEKMNEIRELCFSTFEITCMHVYHSLGKILVGEICLFVFVSSPHRKAATDACSFLVEKIKNNLPICGKEIFENKQEKWEVKPL